VLLPLQCSAVSFQLSSPSLREEKLIDSSLIICDPSGMSLPQWRYDLSA
jgi:hypothetical protein